MAKRITVQLTANFERKLEEVEQRRALHTYLQGVRQRAETRCLNNMAG